MPELPEVDVVRQGLADHLIGQTFVDVQVTGARSARRHLLGPQHLADSLRNRTVTGVERRGKYLWLTFEDAVDALVVHLGMSGQMLVEAATAPLEKHAHAVFDLAEAPKRDALSAHAKSSEPMQVRFVDPRTFGGLFLDELVDAHGRLVPSTIAHIAPDPLESVFDADAVVARMRSKRVAVKRLLLDQTIVSGIGNIYADEALWRAQVHGQRLGSALSTTQLAAVLQAAADVMREALAQGGTSFDSMYVNVNGASGYFSRSLDAYGQQGKPCRRCGALIVREEFMNRSSHFCPVCQSGAAPHRG